MRGTLASQTMHFCRINYQIPTRIYEEGRVSSIALFVLDPGLRVRGQVIGYKFQGGGGQWGVKEILNSYSNSGVTVNLLATREHGDFQGGIFR